MTSYMKAAAPTELIQPRFGGAQEQAIVLALIRRMAAHEFFPHSLAVQGEGYVRTPDERSAWCEVWEWDAYVTLRFKRNGDSTLYGVLLISGNGEDIISDYTADDGAFEKALDEFKPENVALQALQEVRTLRATQADLVAALHQCCESFDSPPAHQQKAFAAARAALAKVGAA